MRGLGTVMPCVCVDELDHYHLNALLPVTVTSVAQLCSQTRYLVDNVTFIVVLLLPVHVSLYCTVATGNALCLSRL